MLGDRPNQLDRLREDVSVSAADLLAVSKTRGDITEAGLRNNINVAHAVPGRLAGRAAARWPSTT